MERDFRLGDWIAKNMTVLERSGPEWLVVCPNCGRDKCAVNVARKTWQCWSVACGFKGWHPVHLVARQLCVYPHVAEEIMAAMSTGVDLGPVDALADLSAPLKRRLPIATLPPMTWGLKPTQWSYAQWRGISAENMSLFGLGTIEQSGMNSKADKVLTGRLMFPIWDPGGRLVSWVARAIGDHPAKTINMPRACREEHHGEWCACYHETWGLPPVPGCAEAGEVVLGVHLVTPGQPVIVVEGPVDAAVCGPGFVATLGAKCSIEQAKVIAATGASEAIVLYDGDHAGENGHKQAGEMLSQFMPVRAGIAPWGEDPGSLGRHQAIEIAKTMPRLDHEQPLEAR